MDTARRSSMMEDGGDGAPSVKRARSGDDGADGGGSSGSSSNSGSNVWHVAFSSSKKRHYYFHPTTNQSTFELPSEARAVAGPEGTLATEAPSAVKIGGVDGAVFDATEHSQRLKSAQPHPHPEHELQRAVSVEHLREYYNQLCKDHLFLHQAPKESFNHWLFQMFAAPAEHRSEPMVPSSGFRAPAAASANGLSPIERQLIEVVPMYIKPERYIATAQEASKILQLLVNNNLKFIQEYGKTIAAPEELIQKIQSATSAALIWLDNNKRQSREQFLQKLTELRTQVAEPAALLAAAPIKEIITGLNAAADKEVQKLAELRAKMMTPSTSGLPFSFDPPLARDALHAHLDRHYVHVNYLNCGAMVMQVRTWNKLRQLYQRQHAHEELFLPRLWCMLRRYQTLSGVKAFEGSGFQAALPESVFKYLKTAMDVDFECFASPLNCYFPNFCSAFPDTDRFFGSMGSFFDTDIVEGSLEANPPFNEEAMFAMAERIDHLLCRSKSPLSFCVFVPEWVNPPTPALARMLKSPYLRAERVILAFQHTFKNGSQHLVEDNDMYFSAVHDSHIFVLQNDAGFAKWPPTSAVLDGIQAAWAEPLDRVSRRFVD